MSKKFSNPHICDTLVTNMISAVSSLDKSSDEAAIWNKNMGSPSCIASVGFNPPCKTHLLSHLTKHGVTYTVWSQHAAIPVFL
jgi:hypothetical protein